MYIKESYELVRLVCSWPLYMPKYWVSYLPCGASYNYMRRKQELFICIDCSSNIVLCSIPSLAIYYSMYHVAPWTKVLIHQCYLGLC